MTAAQYFAMFMRYDAGKHYGFPADPLYADSISDDQMLKWCRRWKRGVWFGTPAAPDYKPKVFDCSRRTQHFLSFIHAENVRAGSEVVQPVHSINANFINAKGEIERHLYVRFVQDGKFRYFNQETEMFSDSEAAHDYAEMV
jgi:hypothetical protein